jgi:hypothetical protein
MKVIFLLGLVIVASITAGTQGTLSNGKWDVTKTFNKVRGLAIRAAYESLENIRNDLNYLSEDTMLYNVYSKKGFE